MKLAEIILAFLLQRLAVALRTGLSRQGPDRAAATAVRHIPGVIYALYVISRDQPVDRHPG